MNKRNNKILTYIVPTDKDFPKINVREPKVLNRDDALFV